MAFTVVSICGWFNGRHLDGGQATRHAAINDGDSQGFFWRVERKSGREGKEQGSMEGDDCVVVVVSGGGACCRITEWTGYQCHTMQFLG